MNSPLFANFQHDAEAALHYSVTAVSYGKIRRLAFAECRFSRHSMLRSINPSHLKETIPLIYICVMSRFFIIFLNFWQKTPIIVIVLL